MYNKAISRLSFCDIQNNQGLGKGFQPKPKSQNLILESIVLLPFHSFERAVFTNYTKTKLKENS